MLYSVQRGEEKNLRLRCEFHRTLTLTQWVAEIRSIDMFLNVAYHLVYDKHGCTNHLSLLIMSRKYLLLCPAYWTQWEQHGELRSPCNSGVRAFGPIKQLGDSDSIYIALQYRHSKCYPLRLHSITIDLYTVTGQDRDGQLNFDHLYSMYMYVFVSNIYI